MSDAELKTQTAKDKKAVEEAPDLRSRLTAVEAAKLTALERIRRLGGLDCDW